jgi:hypothetical protein
MEGGHRTLLTAKRIQLEKGFESADASSWYPRFFSTTRYREDNSELSHPPTAMLVRSPRIVERGIFVSAVSVTLPQNRRPSKFVFGEDSAGSEASKKMVEHYAGAAGLSS